MSSVYLTRNQVEVLYNEVERFYLEDQPAVFERGVVLADEDLTVTINQDGDGGGGGVIVELTQS